MYLKIKAYKPKNINFNCSKRNTSYRLIHHKNRGVILCAQIPIYRKSDAVILIKELHNGNYVIHDNRKEEAYETRT